MASVQVSIAVKNDISATTIFFHEIFSRLRPISSIAVGASESPIIIIIGPTTIGGSNLLIHFLPIALIINATKTYTSPTAIIPVKTLSFPLLTKATIIGVINANELPK